jgi:hypothetical protein
VAEAVRRPAPLRPHYKNGRLRQGCGIDDHRLNTASSCIGCRIDGMNRSNNDLRDWLDAGGGRLPKGHYGVDGWIKDDATVARSASSIRRHRRCDARSKAIAASS